MKCYIQIARCITHLFLQCQSTKSKMHLKYMSQSWINSSAFFFECTIYPWIFDLFSPMPSQLPGEHIQSGCSGIDNRTSIFNHYPTRYPFYPWIGISISFRKAFVHLWITYNMSVYYVSIVYHTVIQAFNVQTQMDPCGTPQK